MYVCRSRVAKSVLAANIVAASFFFFLAKSLGGVDCEKRDACNLDDHDDDNDVAINLSRLILECYLITLKVCRKVGDFSRVPNN